ncbi:MAG TPA: haloacid dehalogenase type II [Rhizobiales bacterium]|nr:haloacid dehalogenase type II [Hyphomicrobiales bacterium]
MSLKLSDFTTLAFDCYGTLIDWETGIWDAYQLLIASNGRDDITRQTALEAHAELESAQQAATPALLYPQVLAHVHHQFAARFGLASDDRLDRVFGASVPFWPAFGDTADALRVLKKHFRLVILSNVNRAGFSVSARKLGVEFDAVYTAEDIGSYKPDARNFDFMLDRLKADFGVERSEILHTAQSLFHDHVPATRAGLARAWIDRQGLRNSENWGATAKVAKQPEVDFVFSTLGEMAGAM